MFKWLYKQIQFNINVNLPYQPLMRMLFHVTKFIAWNYCSQYSSFSLSQYIWVIMLIFIAKLTEILNSIIYHMACQNVYLIINSHHLSFKIQSEYSQMQFTY